MAFEISKNFGILEKALFYRKVRQDMIASNIANADTPYYRPKDIRFEEALKAQMKKANTLQLAKTDAMHLDGFIEDKNNKPIVFYRDGHLARNDGNSVDIDIEMSEMSKNIIGYNATIAAIKKDIELFKAVIDSSKNI